MVRKRDDGRWEGRIVVGHKKNGDPIHRYVLARTQKELIVKLHDCIEMYRDADLTEDSKMTLGEWLDRWINEYMIFTIRESTLDSYKAMIKNQIKPYLGDRPLSALTTQELQKFYNSVKKKGRVKTARKNLRKGTFGQNDKGDTCQLPHCFTAGGTGRFDTNQSRRRL